MWFMYHMINLGRWFLHWCFRHKWWFLLGVLATFLLSFVFATGWFLPGREWFLLGRELCLLGHSLTHTPYAQGALATSVAYREAQYLRAASSHVVLFAVMASSDLPPATRRACCRTILVHSFLGRPRFLMSDMLALSKSLGRRPLIA